MKKKADLGNVTDRPGFGAGFHNTVWTIPGQIDYMLAYPRDDWEEGYLAGLLEKFNNEKV